MKICWGNHISLAHIHQANGFGYATKRIIDSLRNLGHEVSDTMENPDVEIWFDQPHWVKWKSTAPVKIIYVPWESTHLFPGWRHKLNSADEVWTPSPIVAEWLVRDGVNVPVHVFQHGVDDIWEPRQRLLDGNFNLLHHGGEAARKGWDMTAKMYVEHFLGKDTEMFFKMQLPGWNIPLPGIHVIQDKIPVDDLVRLYHKSHLMVYPSWGEGFGLTPLQAMATGMPVLITKGWAPYEHLVPRQCLIESELVDSPWPWLHPGQMFKPDYDDMAHKAKNIHENYNSFARKFLALSFQVKREYQWDDHTRMAFESLKNRWKI